MKVIKPTLLIFLFLSLVFLGMKQYSKNKFKKESAALFLQNIESGKKNQIDEFSQFEGYNFEVFKTKKVIYVNDSSKLAIKEALDDKNVFINFWYKGCGGCEAEMPEIQRFYEKYGKQITFIILSNDKPEVVKEYIKKQGFTMPFYVFDGDNFPVGIKVFPTSHLILNHKTKFMYAGVGHFDNDGFYAYIENAL